MNSQISTSDIINTMTDLNLQFNIKECFSYSDICRALGYSINGTGIRKAKQFCKDSKFDISHFDIHHQKKKQAKFKIVEKICPSCGQVFKTKNNSKETTTCSYGCSNKHFRSGSNHGNWKKDTYRTTCFEHHNKKCVVCHETNIVAVHHYDGNHNNNDPRNLIPLCPTHHQYLHSKFKQLIVDKVEQYVLEFSKQWSEM